MKKASKETCEGLAERSRRPCVLNISSRLGPISRSEGLEQNGQERAEQKVCRGFP